MPIVSAEEQTRYTQIIDGILATVNLETVTRKKIRAGLETALGGKDLSEQKVSCSKCCSKGRQATICKAYMAPTSPYYQVFVRTRE
jgi:hypothetical protein